MGRHSTRASFLVLIALTTSAPTRAGLFGPDGFHECILERLEDAQNDLVAIEQATQCRQEFPSFIMPEKISPLLFGARTQSECIRAYAQGTSSQYAAGQLREACIALYPEKLDDEPKE
jgi:hypothetical protein